MKILLNEKTKQEKIMNEVQKKRNLFGLGLTSLIAACGATDKATNDTTATIDLGVIPQTDLEALTAADADQANTALDNPEHLITALTPGSNWPTAREGLGDLRVTISRDSNVLGGIGFGATFQNGNHTTTLAKASVYQDLAVAGKNSLVVSSSEFGDVTGAADMITGAVYILWDIQNGIPDGIDNVDVDTNAKRLKIAGVAGSDVIAADSPKFYQIGGAQTTGNEPADQYDMVFGSTKGINILWDVTQHATTTTTTTTTVVATTATLGAADNGMLQVQNVALTGSEFKKINNNEDYDMVVKGTGDTANTTYILWDVANYYDATANVVVNLADPTATGTEASHGLLTVTGTGTADPSFKKINNNEDYDMVVTNATTAYILWDVANYHDATAKVEVNLADPTATGAEASHGLLTVTGTGTADPEFIKVNNNEDYDMIVKGTGSTSDSTYILWDVANYHDPAENVVVDLAAATTATHGLLTIANMTGGIKKATDKGGLTDIDGKGINDLALEHDGQIFILFGEKVANRDEESGAAISHSVDLHTVRATNEFYNKDGVAVAEPTGGGAKEGFFDFDLDGNDMIDDVEKNVGYYFNRDLTTLEDVTNAYEAVINSDPAEAAGGALSEEAYWDVA